MHRQPIWGGMNTINPIWNRSSTLPTRRNTFILDIRYFLTTPFPLICPTPIPLFPNQCSECALGYSFRSWMKPGNAEGITIPLTLFTPTEMFCVSVTLAPAWLSSMPSRMPRHLEWISSCHHVESLRERLSCALSLKSEPARGRCCSSRPLPDPRRCRIRKNPRSHSSHRLAQRGKWSTHPQHDGRHLHEQGRRRNTTTDWSTTAPR